MTSTLPDGKPEANLCCSFCHKSEREIRCLVAGPGVSICDMCVDVCSDIMAAGRTPATTPAAELPRLAWPSGVHCSLCRMPVALEDAVPVEDRGPLCRPCVTSIQAALSRRVER